MDKKQAKSIAVGLSAPSKMPCHGYSIPAARCVTGAKLAKVGNSVCHGCYALKGNYRFGNVQRALEKRFEALQHPQWVAAMVCLILDTKNPFFRWHDSGDIQSVEHLAKIVEVCERTPSVRHWLPTREYKIVQDYLKSGAVIPANLTIRLSAHMRDTAPPSGYGLPTSTVHSHGNAPNGSANPLKIFQPIPASSRVCPAPTQGNQCRDCRTCWDSNVANVSYTAH
jgi:hypothetical protein